MFLPSAVVALGRERRLAGAQRAQANSERKRPPASECLQMPTRGSRLETFLRPSWNALTVNRTPVSPQRRAFCFQALISLVSPFRFASSTRTWCSRCRSSPREEPQPRKIFVEQDDCGTRNRRTLAMRQGSTMSIVVKTPRLLQTAH